MEKQTVDALLKAKDDVIEAKDAALHNKDSVIQMKDELLAKALADIEHLRRQLADKKEGKRTRPPPTSSQQDPMIDTHFGTVKLKPTVTAGEKVWGATVDVLDDKGVHIQWHIVIKPDFEKGYAMIVMLNFSRKDIRADIKLELLGLKIHPGVALFEGQGALMDRFKGMSQEEFEEEMRDPMYDERFEPANFVPLMPLPDFAKKTRGLKHIEARIKINIHTDGN